MFSGIHRYVNSVICDVHSRFALEKRAVHRSLPVESIHFPVFSVTVNSGKCVKTHFPAFTVQSTHGK